MNKFEGNKERWEGVLNIPTDKNFANNIRILENNHTQVRLLCSKLDGESRTELQQHSVVATALGSWRQTRYGEWGGLARNVVREREALF